MVGIVENELWGLIRCVSAVLSDDIVEQRGHDSRGHAEVERRLPAERALAEKFGVSRPSLREGDSEIGGQRFAGQSPGRRQLCG